MLGLADVGTEEEALDRLEADGTAEPRDYCVAVKFVRVFAHQSVFRLVFRGVLLAMKLRGRRRRRIVLSTVFYVWSAQHESPW